MEHSEPVATSRNLWKLGYETIKQLETERGILASGRNEIFGCIFGRDSLLTSLKLLKVYRKTGDKYFVRLVRKILLNLANLQGREHNIESGEQPGKCIHEYRPENHEHLTKRPVKPWYVYPDGVMRNYDSIDSTPLFLIACYRYLQVSPDQDFLSKVGPHIEQALRWILKYGDSNGDGFIDYRFPRKRKYGGLRVQNWMDSRESLFHETGERVRYPVAPIEVQAYTYLALRLWEHDGKLEHQFELGKHARALKERFDKHFVVKQGEGLNFPAALDGAGKPVMNVRSSIGHILWASLTPKLDGVLDTILYDEYIPLLVKRILASDLFEENAGIRTLSTTSRRFRANSYHNGSIWPHDTNLIVEGLEAYGYYKEAGQIRSAMIRAINYFQTPIELFVYDNGKYKEFQTRKGKTACRKQAWSAAALLTATSTLEKRAA